MAIRAANEMEGTLKRIAEQGAAGTISATEQDRQHAIGVAARKLFRFGELLREIGFDENTVGEAIRIGADRIPVFCQQLSGQYLRPNGDRCPHFAVPGWYRIESIDGPTVRLLKEIPPEKTQADPFLVGKHEIRFVLAVNLEYVQKGLQP